MGGYEVYVMVTVTVKLDGAGMRKVMLIIWARNYMLRKILLY